MNMICINWLRAGRLIHFDMVPFVSAFWALVMHWLIDWTKSFSFIGTLSFTFVRGWTECIHYCVNWSKRLISEYQIRPLYQKCIREKHTFFDCSCNDAWFTLVPFDCLDVAVSWIWCPFWPNACRNSIGSALLKHGNAWVCVHQRAVTECLASFSNCLVGILLQLNFFFVFPLSNSGMHLWKKIRESIKFSFLRLESLLLIKIGGWNKNVNCMMKLTCNRHLDFWCAKICCRALAGQLQLIKYMYIIYDSTLRSEHCCLWVGFLVLILLKGLNINFLFLVCIWSYFSN